MTQDDIISLVIMAAIVIACILVSIRYVRLILRTNPNRGYANCYVAMFKRFPEAYEQLLEFMDKYKKYPDYVAKAYVLKLYMDLEAGRDTKEDLDNIDFKTIFFNKKGKYSKVLYDSNSEVFLWVSVVMNKAHMMGRDDIVEELFTKASSCGDKVVEMSDYCVSKAVYDVLHDNQEGVDFFRNLLNGDYDKKYFTKSMISIYKHLAEMMFAYKGIEINEDDVKELRLFANTALGKFMLEDMNLYEKFPPLRTTLTDEEFYDQFDDEDDEETEQTNQDNQDNKE